MRLDQAISLKVGDVVYNVFMDELVITSIFKQSPEMTIFSTIDTRLNRETYQYCDLYLKNLEEESDEEKSFVDWAIKNRNIVNQEDYSVFGSVKRAYMAGFSQGFKYKRHISAQEQLQK
jgi:hypothetical protein